MAPVPVFAHYRRHLDSLIAAALEAAHPAACLQKHQAEIIALAAQARHQARRIWLVGAGKAALEMALAAYDLLGASLAGGAVAVVPQRLEQLDSQVRAALPFQLYPAAHPLPDERNLQAARAIAAVARQAGPQDLLLVLLSGGGSAHLALPVEGLALAEYQRLIADLMRAGAPIEDLNAVRKHAEQLKGGGLLQLAAPARVAAFILSDVVGDALDVIASGPVSADPSTFGEALAVCQRYGIRVPAALRAHLEAGQCGERPETLKPGDALLGRASHTIIGSNRLAVQAVRKAALELGFEIGPVELDVQGEARRVGQRLGRLGWQLRQQDQLPCAAICGGETTVTVRGTGRGGRNQELVLAAALDIEGLENVVVLSFATDGIDGQSTAAGAYADGNTCRRARRLGLEPQAYLANNDSGSFFEQLGTTIQTGPTGTNVNDVALVLVY